MASTGRRDLDWVSLNQGWRRIWRRGRIWGDWTQTGLITRPVDVDVDVDVAVEAEIDSARVGKLVLVSVSVSLMLMVVVLLMMMVMRETSTNLEQLDQSTE